MFDGNLIVAGFHKLFLVRCFWVSVVTLSHRNLSVFTSNRYLVYASATSQLLVPIFITLKIILCSTIRVNGLNRDLETRRIYFIHDDLILKETSES